MWKHIRHKDNRLPDQGSKSHVMLHSPFSAFPDNFITIHNNIRSYFAETNKRQPPPLADIIQHIYNRKTMYRKNRNIT